MKTISRYIMTLALLLTAVTGAWATDTYTITFSANGKNKTYTDVALPAEYKCEYGSPGEFDNIIQELYGQDGGHGIENATPTVTGTNAITPGLESSDYAMITITAPFTGKATVSGTYSGYSNNSGSSNINYSIEVYFGTPSSSTPVTVTWDAATKTGTFTMPDADVELTPIYAKAAAFATTGTGSEVKTLLPEAAEGVIAGTDASLIAEGTGIVAFAGESTEVTQGTLMYAIGTSATEAPALTDFSATVPTAENVADDGADVYVWYYIQGADAPQGEAATLDNTFDDTEPACLTVTVLSNKFDIQFNAANANTIEAGKATVTVGGTAATVTDGKLQGVKMGSEVKLEAKPGYKFRKVEVKKAASTPTLKDALKDGATVVITYTWMGETTFTYTNNGGNYTGNTTGYDAAYFSNGMSKDGTTLKFTASNMDISEANVSIDFYTDSNEYSVVKGSAFTSFTISVNGTDVTSQLTEVK